MKSISLAIICLALSLSGCGGDRVECFPGTRWSERASGCVRFIPDEERTVRFIPEPLPRPDYIIIDDYEREDRYDVSNVRIRDNDAD